jgi:DNA-binding transcriptional LysR family regulator
VKLCEPKRVHEDVELRHLRYFRMVAEELNFRRAAERLFMEPQPLNFQIRQLERELGFRLFSHRDGRTQLTAAGETFSRDVESLLSATEQAVARAGQVARGETGTLRVAIPSHMANELLAPAIMSFHRDYPGVSFTIRQLAHAQQVDGLLRSQIELAIGILHPDDPRLDSRALTRGRAVVAVPADDALAALDVVPWDALDGREAVLLDPEEAPLARKWIDGMLADHAVKLRESQSVGDIESAISFASFGFGLAIALAPIGMRPHHPGVTFVDLPPDAAELEIGAIWLHGDENALRDKFVDTLAELTSDFAEQASAS